MIYSKSETFTTKNMMSIESQMNCKHYKIHQNINYKLLPSLGVP